jgi:hypothetical protein
MKSLLARKTGETNKKGTVISDGALLLLIVDD